MLRAARCKYRTQKIAKKSPSAHHPTTLSFYSFASKSYIDNRKNLLSTNMSSTCPHNIVNFGPLAPEIVSLVWGTPANFNGFRFLAALLHGTLVVRVSQTVALNRGRHLYSAGRPSRWALAHISSSGKGYLAVRGCEPPSNIQSMLSSNRHTTGAVTSWISSSSSSSI